MTGQTENLTGISNWWCSADYCEGRASQWDGNK